LGVGFVFGCETQKSDQDEDGKHAEKDGEDLHPAHSISIGCR
jgi:hypothetical protein